MASRSRGIVDTTYWSDLGLAIDGDDAVVDGVHIEHGRLLIIDDGRSKHRPEDSRVADGEIAALKIRHAQFSVPSLIPQGVRRCRV